MDLLHLNADEFMSNSVAILDTLKQTDQWHRLPLLNNIENNNVLVDGQLVRFRGLVQDMLDPEIYLEKFETTLADGTKHIKRVKYRDNINLEPGERILHESTENVHKERRALFMVTVPGLNDWAIDIEKKLYGINAIASAESHTSNGIKRNLEQTSEPMDEQESPMQTKKLASNANDIVDQQSNGLSREYLLNSPIVDRPSKACMVKFYDHFTDITLNSMLDVVGFLSVDPSLCGSLQKDDDDVDNFQEVCAKNPPPSLIPRLHAIASRPVNHLNPMHSDVDINTLMTAEQMAEVYKDLKLIFTQSLFGDEIAAEYLLCHLISTVYVRAEQTLGQFSLNITNIPAEVLPEYTKHLYEIIAALLPASHYFPVTLEHLNSLEFIPKKDYDTGKLTSGLLQLAPHTHLILDETCLQPGKLENHGIESVVHISNLIQTQKLKVNFKFYEIEYDTNVPVLILSEGKSMFSSNCHLPLQVDSDAVRLIKETMTAGQHFLKPKLDAMRTYLTMMRLRDFDMNPESLHMIQEDFVAMRKDYNASADDLHTMLIVSRMLGILKGRINLDSASWNAAKQLEQIRRDRVNVIPKK